MKRPFLAAIVVLIVFSACGGGAPRITSVDPKEVKSGQSGMLDIKGSGFQPGAVVKIGGVQSSQTVVSGTKEVIALLPRDLPAGVAAVVVENPNGTKAELAAALKVLTGMSIAAVEPGSINQGEATTVNLTGDGFAAGVKVFFNDLPAEAEFKSPQLIVAKVPALPAGLATIRLEAADGGRAELPSGFQVMGADQIKTVRPLRDESEALGVTGPNMQSRNGVGVGDFDGDGKLDLAITNQTEVRLLLAGVDKFNDATAASGIKAPPITYGVYPADFDNDGLTDLFISGQPGKLFRNTGGGKFEDVTVRVGLPIDYQAWSAAWGDYDGDGLIDLYIGAPGGEDTLYHNLGGKFEPVFGDRWQKMQIAAKANNKQPSTFSVVFGDMNNDGFSELMVGVRGQESRIYRNQGGKDFVFSNLEAGLNFFVNGFYKINWGLSWADYDNDGLLDLFSAAGPTGADLYRNVDGKTFTNVTAGMGVTFANSPLCPAWGDIDNDGLMDLALADNQSGVFVYRNRGDGSFQNVTRELGLAGANALITPMALTWIDYNRDGALDLYCVGFDQPNRMLVNSPYPGRHYLQVKLEGTKSNHLGIDAMVVLEVLGKKYTQQVAGGSGYLMSPSPILHFGLDQATVVDKLTVRWPGGSVQTMEQVPADQLLTVTEPGERRKITLPPPAATAPGQPSSAPAGMIMPKPQAPPAGKPSSPAPVAPVPPK